MAKGIVSGAKVVRGPDWDWDNQDGQWTQFNQKTHLKMLSTKWQPFWDLVMPYVTKDLGQHWFS